MNERSKQFMIEAFGLSAVQTIKEAKEKNEDLLETEFFERLINLWGSADLAILDAMETGARLRVNEVDDPRVTRAFRQWCIRIYQYRIDYWRANDLVDEPDDDTSH